MGLDIIPKKDIFKEFKIFMLKKTIEEITKSTQMDFEKQLEKRKAQYEQQKKKEAEETLVKKKKDEEKSKPQPKTVAKIQEPPKPQPRSPTLTEPYDPESPRSETENYEFYSSTLKNQKEVPKEAISKVSKIDTTQKSK
jgi:hypothetical protein